MPKRNWKDLTKREKFLVTMQEINNTLIEDQRLTKKEILNLYDSEIAPYGYPSHQEFLLYQSLLTQAFNENILNGKYKGTVWNEFWDYWKCRLLCTHGLSSFNQWYLSMRNLSRDRRSRCPLW